MAPDAQDTKEKKKVMLMAEYTGPGPARYSLPTTIGQNSNDKTKRSSPSFTFGARHWSYRAAGPGPSYSIDSITSKGPANAPSFSMLGRARTPKNRDYSPGPGAYNVDLKPPMQRSSPSYSLSPRTNLRKIDVTPSPNSYLLPTTLGANVPHRKGGPAARLSGKTNFMDFAADLSKTPGPAKYNIKEQEGKIKRPPAFSITGKPRSPKPINNVPGPGAYRPEDVTAHLENSPRYAVGTRHSQFVMPVMPIPSVD